MKKFFFALIVAIVAFSCGEEPATEKPSVIEDTQLIVDENGMHTEFYPGKKQIKIQGATDEKGERNGRWVFFSPEGKQLNFTMYEHGKKHGHTYNAYENGAPYYYGEYWSDTMIGVWKTYDSKGNVTVKDYGLPEGY